MTRPSLRPSSLHSLAHHSKRPLPRDEGEGVRVGVTQERDLVSAGRITRAT